MISPHFRILKLGPTSWYSMYEWYSMKQPAVIVTRNLSKKLIALEIEINMISTKGQRSSTITFHSLTVMSSSLQQSKPPINHQKHTLFSISLFTFQPANLLLFLRFWWRLARRDGGQLDLMNVEWIIMVGEALMLWWIQLNHNYLDGGLCWHVFVCLCKTQVTVQIIGRMTLIPLGILEVWFCKRMVIMGLMFHLN